MEGFPTMPPTEKAKILPAKELGLVSARLYARADEVNQITLQDLSLDLRVAGRAVDLLTHIRAEISQIAGKCKDLDAARELRDLLDDGEEV
jgi:hypothetical protein